MKNFIKKTLNCAFYYLIFISLSIFLLTPREIFADGYFFYTKTRTQKTKKIQEENIIKTINTHETTSFIEIDENFVNFLEKDGELYIFGRAYGEEGAWKINETGEWIKLDIEDEFNHERPTKKYIGFIDENVVYYKQANKDANFEGNFYLINENNQTKILHKFNERIESTSIFNDKIYYITHNPQNNSYSLRSLDKEGNVNILYTDQNKIGLDKFNDNLYIALDDGDEIELTKVNENNEHINIYSSDKKKWIGGSSSPFGEIEWRDEILMTKSWKENQIIENNFNFAVENEDEVEIIEIEDKGDTEILYSIPKDIYGDKLITSLNIDDKTYYLTASKTNPEEQYYQFSIWELSDDNLTQIYQTENLPSDGFSYMNIKENRLFFKEDPTENTSSIKMLNTKTNEIVTVKDMDSYANQSPHIGSSNNENPNVYFAVRPIGTNVFSIYELRPNNEVYLVESIVLSGNEHIQDIAMKGDILYFTIGNKTYEKIESKETKMIDTRKLKDLTFAGNIKDFSNINFEIYR